MASIYKRVNDDESISWRAVIRIKGHARASATFEYEEQARKWAENEERIIRSAPIDHAESKEKSKGVKSLVDMIAEYICSGVLANHASKADTLRHLLYWKERLAGVPPNHITVNLLLSERKLLVDSERGIPTVNNYMVSLSAFLTWACRDYRYRELSWADNNPCMKISKLKG